MRVAALVPMGSHSIRVAGKNWRELAGRPLYCHILEALLRCGSVDEVVVDTDAPRIAQGVSARFGGRVRLIERPVPLRGGHVSMNDILLHDVTQAPADWYVMTHATNPLLRAETIERGIRAMVSSADHDSLVGVTRMFKRYWWGDGRPVNHDPSTLINTQDLAPFYEENSNLYMFTRPLIEARGTRVGERPLLLEIDARESVDIDDELDFEIAEFFIARATSPAGDEPEKG